MNRRFSKSKATREAIARSFAVMQEIKQQEQHRGTHPLQSVPSGDKIPADEDGREAPRERHAG